jgi:hypothetical protein
MSTNLRIDSFLKKLIKKFSAFGYVVVFIVITVLNSLSLIYIAIFAHEIRAESSMHDSLEENSKY